MGVKTDINEVWLHLPDPFDRYEVSDMGSLRQHGSGRVLSPCAGPDGYFRMPLRLRGGIKRTMYLHRLVAMMFCPGDQMLTVNHIDMDRTHNHASNLEWISFSDNHKKKFAMHPGLRQRISDRLRIPIIGKCEQTRSETRYESGKSAAIALGNPNRAGNIAVAIKTGCVAYGCRWRYDRPPLVVELEG